jgi:hypothetical protein
MQWEKINQNGLEQNSMLSHSNEKNHEKLAVQLNQQEKHTRCCKLGLQKISINVDKKILR